MNEVLEKIQKIGIVPVVVLNDAKDAAPLAKALCDGGLPCAEVTFRTDAAEESIRIMAEQFPNMLVGAGTVLTTDQVDRAVAAGAKFIVSPGLNPKIVRYCVEKNIPITPGTTNPSDIEQAIECGLEVVKFFPAEPAGGIDMIKAMAAGNTASAFEKMFGFTSKEGNSSYFAGTGVEVMKTPYKGTNGHIAVSTNYIDRAVSYLEMLGYEFDMSTAKYDAKNNLKAVYFTGEVGGFAVHLVQK